MTDSQVVLKLVETMFKLAKGEGVVVETVEETARHGLDLVERLEKKEAITDAFVWPEGEGWGV